MKKIVLILAAFLLSVGSAKAQCFVGGFQSQVVVNPFGFNAFLAPSPVVFSNGFVGGANVVNIGGFGGFGFRSFGGFNSGFGAAVVSPGFGGSFQQINEQRGLLGRVRNRQITQFNGGAGGSNIANIRGRR